MREKINRWERSCFLKTEKANGIVSLGLRKSKTTGFFTAMFWSEYGLQISDFHF